MFAAPRRGRIGDADTGIRGVNRHQFDMTDDPGDRDPAARPSAGKPFLGVQFRCCRVYGRLYRDPSGSAYQGRCPRCGAFLTVPIGRGGTSRRFFSAG
jgi:hypothetical protein